jgi:hypothetical protein
MSAPKIPQLHFDETPKFRRGYIPGTVTVAFGNEHRIKISKESRSVRAGNAALASAINGVLARHKLRALFDQTCGQKPQDFDARAQRLSAQAGFQVPSAESVHTYIFDPSEDANQIVSEFKSLPGVRSAFQEVAVEEGAITVNAAYHGSFAFSPTDPYFFKWHPDCNTSLQRDFWWWFNRHRIFQAHSLYGNNYMPRVAVIDSGFDPNGPFVYDTYEKPLMDLSQAASFNADGTKQPVTDVSQPADSSPFSHGTFVAGVLAAPKGNAYGSCGFAPGATIIPIRVPVGTVSGSTLAAAINYAADYTDANVISISMITGGLPLTGHLSAKNAIWHAVVDKGKSVVICAGNDLINLDAYTGVEKCGEIMVGGIGKDGREWVESGTLGSNWGKVVDLAAAATAIGGPAYHAGSGSRGFTYSAGTSFATPLVAATAAMVRQIGGTTYQNPYNVASTIIHTSNVAPSNNGYLYLGKDLDKPNNVGHVARIRYLNAENAIAMAKFCADSPLVARVYNVDDRNLGCRNWTWGASQFGDMNGYLTDDIYNLSGDGYQSGDKVAFYSGNDGGNWSSGMALFKRGWCTGEHIRGVVSQPTPWGVTNWYTIPGMTGDNQVGWVNPLEFTVANPY